MSNRLIRRRKAVIAGCIFTAVAALLLVQGGQAASLSYNVQASGDHLFVAGDLSWMAGSVDLGTVPPLTCGGEVLQGGHAVRVMSTGPSSYSHTGTLDASDLLLFQQVTEATAINGVYRDGLFIDGCGAPWSESACGPMPTEGEVDSFAPYCSGASIQSSAMGRNLNVQSQGAIVQAGTDFPDSMAAGIRISGDGMAKIQMRSYNIAGLAGNTSEIGYINSMNQRAMAGGKAFALQAGFEWTSFAGLFAEPEPAEEDLPAETG
jgi:hypothetical protein